MKTANPILLDTNVLVYNHQEDGEYYGQARATSSRKDFEKSYFCAYALRF